MSEGARPAKILHLHSSFAPGGKELRTVQLINAFGRKAEHTIVSGTPGEYGAGKGIHHTIKVRHPNDFPSLQGKPLPGRLNKLARRMAAFDLVLTYNWGAMDAAMAHTLLAQHLNLPPLIHHEDGFNADEAKKLKASRNWYRRIALGRSAAIVVPSHTLGTIARQAWQQPADRVHRIPNGIDTAPFRKKPKSSALPRIIKRPGEKWFGTLAGLRAVKQLDHLIDALEGLPEEWHCVIMGDGPEKQALRDHAENKGLSARVHFPGHIAKPADAVGLLDIFALSSSSEQFPISVLEAMAAGLPVVAPHVGDIARMVAEENMPYITSRDHAEGVASAIAALADDEAVREALGAANRAKVNAEFTESTMVESYRALYNRYLPPEARL